MTRTAIVLFTRDLRVHANPALTAAAREADRVQPLFVLDDALLRDAGANRRAYLAEALDDLAGSLGGLTIARGETVAEAVKLARRLDARDVYLAEDASAFAKQREARLRRELDVHAFPSTSIVEPGELRSSTGGHYRIFTPYWRAWQSVPRRPVLPRPRVQLALDDDDRAPLSSRGASPGRQRGGESAARQRLTRFVRTGLAGYDDARDDLAADATSRLSADLHFGCLSPLEVAERTASSESFVRQLCWRDFFLQLLDATPSLAYADQRRRRMPWVDDDEALAAWREGRTGVPIVDAGMRQLAEEGWMHNRARLIVSSFLTKTLGLHWRHGADHFAQLLVDGDVASNSGNWQWAAGTGNDPRPNRILNPLRQARRFDPDGDYVRRYVPELRQ